MSYLKRDVYEYFPMLSTSVCTYSICLTQIILDIYIYYIYLISYISYEYKYYK